MFDDKGYAAFDENNARFAMTQMMSPGAVGGSQPVRQVLVLSGDKIWSFIESLAPGMVGSSSGTIAPAAELSRLSLSHTPFFLAFRFVGPTPGATRALELRIAGHSERNGHPCVVLEQDHSAPPGATPPLSRWWLAEDMEHSVLAWRMLQKGRDRLRALVDVDYYYKQDEQIGWRLSSWKKSWFRTGKEELSTVTGLKINEPISPAEFELIFPKGTRVTDEFRGITFEAGGEADSRDMKALRAVESGDAGEGLVEQAERVTGTRAPGEKSKEKHTDEP